MSRLSPSRCVRAIVLAVSVASIAAAMSVTVVPAATSAGPGATSISSALTSTCTISRTLRAGMRSPQVRCLERRLLEMGMRAVQVDDDFGTATRRAVVAYQRSRRLAADGVVGPQTAGSMGIWHENPWCNRAAERISRRNGGVTQILVVSTSSWTSPRATVRLARRAAGRWTCTAALDSMVGRSGTRPLRQRRSGDGTTPAGVFPLARMRAWDGDTFSFFGNASNPGVPAGAWRSVRYGDCYGASPGTSRYGHLVYRPWCAGPDEYLPRYQQAYTQAAVIGANSEPNVSGDAPGEIPYASAIFVHRHSYDAGGTAKPTAGCVSLSQRNLSYVLSRLDSDVLFAIGPAPYLYHDA